MKRGSSIFLRIFILIVASFLPIIFLCKGVYGSFIFTFSIPLIWQIGIRGLQFESLGLRLNSIKLSIIAGAISGVILGIIGGIGLKILGLTGKLFTSAHKLEFSFAGITASFPLQKEAGYQLLSMNNVLLGTCLFFIFCIVVVALGEEIFWRGFIQKKIANYLPSNTSIIITAILFSLIHFYIFTIAPLKAGILFLVLIAFAGYIWGYLFKYFGNIWASVVSHGITAFIIWKYFFFA